MLDDPQDGIQKIEVSSGEPDSTGGSSQREFLDHAKEKLDRALEEAKAELTELVDEAKEELEEIREKAPGWVKDARRKVADFLEPDEVPKKE
jgi:ElaB/YqjD/DUF883 family membrane-anchored ribosome-binding protein